ncbi:hypothetical protein [Actinokineospora bangkokensis]|nr:hypothetical protein [Actinokineospora bangkokensis]
MDDNSQRPATPQLPVFQAAPDKDAQEPPQVTRAVTAVPQPVFTSRPA